MEPFKNNISPGLVACIADHLAKHCEGFDRPSFESSVLKSLHDLELKQRVQLIADHLHAELPPGHAQRATIMRAVMHPQDDAEGIQPSDDHGIRGWGMLPLTTVVGQHGLDDFDGSMQLLREMTSRFSSEFDVRYFLIADQARALAIMADWINDPNHQVRRLVSEGSRPRLPWGMQLKQLVADPAPILPLLEALKDDETEYVRRSVANNLNDIAKDHPNLVAQTAKKWLRGASGDRRRLVRHACRTLVKQGHPQTLQALGYGKPKLELQRLEVTTPQVTFGDSLQFEIALKSTFDRQQDLIIDYAIHHRKANGTTTPKVFKWKVMSLAPWEKLAIKKHHPMKPITTRKYYPGTHTVEILANGVSLGQVDFDLVMDD